MQAGTMQSDSQKIEIFVSGRNLKDKDLFSKSDPYVKLLMREGQGQWQNFGKTETIKDNLSPNYTKSFLVDFIFEIKQDCRFEVYDDDGSSSELIGFVETTIGKLMGAQKQTSVFDLQVLGNKKPQGKLVTRCDNVKESNEHLYMKWSAKKLTNTDGWFGTSDPFLRFYKIRDDKTIQKIHETEVVMNNLEPQWQAFEVKAARLFLDDFQPFKVECHDWEKDGKFQFIGEATMTMSQIKKGQKEFILKNPKDEESSVLDFLSSKKEPGVLVLNQFQINIKPSFLDYIRGGLQLNLIMAIDFTGSNGTPSQPSSLHYINPNQPNQYQQAIMSVGEILLAYDYDQNVPCYGFGAKIRYPPPGLNSNNALHCFPLTGNPQNVEAQGLQQILEQYNYALRHVELAGPTYFGPIIEESLKVAQSLKQQEQNVYTILLIITDGEIHDMALTIDLIVESSHLPLSIIIIGVGQAEFGNMDSLDGDGGLISSKGQKSKRDLVQFVPFRQYLGNPQQLAKHVLAEIPEQLVNYHQLVGKKPLLQKQYIETFRPVPSNASQVGFN